MFSGSWLVTLRIEMGKLKMCKRSKETVQREVTVQVRDGNSIKSYPRMKVLQDPNWCLRLPFMGFKEKFDYLVIH